MSNAADIREAGVVAVSALDVRTLRVDLSGVTFMDSSGLGALVAIRGAASDLARTVTIVAASERVRQVLEVCGLGSEFGLDAPDAVSAAE